MPSSRLIATAAFGAAIFTLAVSAIVATPCAAWAQAEKVVPPGATAPDMNAKPVIPTGETALFNGRDFSGWYTFLPSKGVSNDPEHIFTVETDGSVHVLGKEFGYFATVVPYANYHLSFEVKWGEKKWKPRDGEKTQRDSGCLVHVFDQDTVWPKSFECQVQERDMGDIFLLGGVSAWANGKQQNGRVVRKMNSEKPHGQWNTVEHSGTQWNTVEHSGTQWNTVEHSGTQWNTVEHSGTQWNTVEHSGTQWNTVEHSGTQWNTVEHSGTQWNTVEHSGTQWKSSAKTTA